MQSFLCVACGTQFAPTLNPPASCPICTDERQFVPRQRQRWTTMPELQRHCENEVIRVDDGLFAALWEHRVVARQSDGMCWAMMRAAEVSRSVDLRDFLKWMQKSPRFRTPAFSERIGNAMAHLKNR